MFVFFCHFIDLVFYGLLSILLVEPCGGGGKRIKNFLFLTVGGKKKQFAPVVLTTLYDLLSVFFNLELACGDAFERYRFVPRRNTNAP